MLEGEDRLNKLVKSLVPIIIAIIAFGFNLLEDGGVDKNIPSGSIKVHFLDVGQADSILIEVDTGQTMLIDAGGNGDSDFVITYIEEQNIEQIDVLIGTHPHEDHIGGLDDVIEHFDIGKIYMPKVTHTTKTFEDVLVAIKNKGVKITTPIAGSTFDLGNAHFQILSPISSTYNNLNNYSITVRLTHGDNSFLFMGDAEKQVEDEIVEKGYSIKTDVLKLGHHGSETSTTEDFLNAVAPKYGIISVGEGNVYQHPHAEVIKRLEDRGIPIYRTDEVGTIVVTSDGKDLHFEYN